MAGCTARHGESRLQPAALGKRYDFPVTDDEVVDEANVNECERLGEALGDGAVGAAGLGDPGCWWNAMRAAAFCIIARRTTTRGCTVAPSMVPWNRCSARIGW